MLNILGSSPALSLFLAAEYLNSWENEPILISVKMDWRKNSLQWEHSFRPELVYKYARYGDLTKRIRLLQNTSQWLLLFYLWFKNFVVVLMSLTVLFFWYFQILVFLIFQWVKLTTDFLWNGKEPEPKRKSIEVVFDFLTPSKIYGLCVSPK